MPFVENVLAILDERRIPNNELARRAGISSGGISKILRSDGNPNLQNMQKIADALDVPLFVLLIDEKSPPSDDGELRREVAKLLSALSPEDLHQMLDYAAFLKSRHGA